MARYRVVNGCNYRKPNPTPEELAHARATGRHPEIRHEIGDEIGDECPSHVITALLELKAIEPIDAAATPTPTPEE